MKTVAIGIILAGLAVAAEAPRAMFGVVAEDNAAVLPMAVKFVTSTYQADVEREEISPLPSVGRNDNVETRKEGGE